MKKLYTLSFTALLLISGKSFSQTFSFTKIDTAKYGVPLTELICASTMINSTANAISMRVTREQNVIPEAPTWTSAFCMDACYLPTTDSVNYTFLPMDTVNFTFHFYTSSTADHATAIMKFKNVNNPSNTFWGTYFGSTDGSLSGINDLYTNSASVSIYPMPIVSGDVFTMNISNVRPEKTISLVVYNMFGSVVSTSNVIAGINFMNFDLPAGIYFYSLISDNVRLNSGKIVIAQ